jgi:hypothetical protein
MQRLVVGYLNASIFLLANLFEVETGQRHYGATFCLQMRCAKIQPFLETSTQPQHFAELSDLADGTMSRAQP